MYSIMQECFSVRWIIESTLQEYPLALLRMDSPDFVIAADLIAVASWLLHTVVIIVLVV